MTRHTLTLADVDPEACVEGRDAREVLDDVTDTRGMRAERALEAQLYGPPAPLTVAQAPARQHRHVSPTAMHAQIPATCAPATLLSRHAVLFTGNFSNHACPVQIDLCGCIYRTDGGLLRYCVGTATHRHQKGPR